MIDGLLHYFDSWASLSVKLLPNCTIHVQIVITDDMLHTTMCIKLWRQNQCYLKIECFDHKVNYNITYQSQDILLANEAVFRSLTWHIANSLTRCKS